MMSLWPFLLMAAVAPLAVSSIHTDVDSLPAIAELPDPFLRAGGKRVTTKQGWRTQRKALLALALRYEYGELPPVPDHVNATETATRPMAEIGATEREVLLTMGPEGAVRCHLLLTVPDGKGPFPMILRGDMCWGRVAPEIVAMAIKRGYGLAQFDRTEIAPDSAERGGVYAAYPEYQGGRLAAWAWGYGRVVDYLLTQPFVDHKRIIATGHSRGGKATLLAGVTDERIALTAPNDSGCGGAGCYRLQADKSEDIAAILKNFPFWFQPDFKAFIGHVDRLPFDQHTLKALIAPRALLTTEALEDLWANPQGTQQTYTAAREVYRFLGVPERIGIAYRHGGHEHNLIDWTALLDFADWQLRNRPTSRRFNELAFPDAPAGYAWRSPGAPLADPFPGKKSDYHGYNRYDFSVDGCDALVVAPHQVAAGKPWIWRAEFFDHRPETDLALLERGFHLVYIQVGNTFGCPSAMKRWDAFYAALTRTYGLGKRPVLEGLSRGGLYVYNWAAANPTKVSVIFGDNPVCDFKSWPGGKGKGPGSPDDWQQLIRDYGFASEAEALAYKRNPIDNLAPLARAHVPIIHLAADADEVVPYPENTVLLKERYERVGGVIQVIVKHGFKHHPHGLDDPTPVVEFILKHTK
jgi:dienelactone hydrolase